MAVKDEKAKLSFLQWQELYEREKPYEIVTESRQGPDGRRTNLVFGTNEEQTIRDVRGIGVQFSLDRHGFTYRSTPSGFDAFESKKRILQEYLPWAASIIKQEAGDAERVFVFDWRVRV